MNFHSARRQLERDPSLAPLSVRPRRTLALACALAVTGLVTACVSVQDSDATRRADSASAVAAKASDSMRAQPVTAARGSGATFATPSAPHMPGPDEPTLIHAMGSPEAQAALRSDTAHSIVDLDVSAPAPAPMRDADLTVLRSELAVPVLGVPRDALRDDYDEMRGGTRKHEALDIGAARGTPVLAAAPGRVLKLFSSKAGGLMVYTADSTGRFILMYGHLDAYQPGLADGQPLTRGQQLGIVGTTGNAPPTVPHLHFAIARTSNVTQWWKGVPVNPYPLLKQ